MVCFRYGYSWPRARRLFFLKLCNKLEHSGLKQWFWGLRALIWSKTMIGYFLERNVWRCVLRPSWDYKFQNFPGTSATKVWACLKKGREEGRGKGECVCVCVGGGGGGGGRKATEFGRKFTHTHHNAPPRFILRRHWYQILFIFLYIHLNNRNDE